MGKFADDFLITSFTKQVSMNHRTILVLIGEKSKEKIPFLHDRLGRISNLNDIVWCYKNSETAMDTCEKKIKIADDDSELQKWIKTFNPEYIMYKEINRILGRTCDFLVLEDFAAITPNIICSCLETVKGGGLIILLFNDQESLNSLISTRPDLIENEDIGEFNPIFNKRLFKSLINTTCTIFLDSKLRIMDVTNENSSINNKVEEVKDIFENEENPLIRSCKTIDQKLVLEHCIKSILDVSDLITIVTASRGRGKSVSMGLAIAEAIDKNLGLICLASLFLENLQTIFEFVIFGLRQLNYKKGTDFKVVYNFEKKKRLIVKIEMTKGNKRTVEFIHPFDPIKYYPSMLVVDEAASIPLEYLKLLLDVKFVFLATTINGYEGTGRSFRTKLTNYISEKKYKHTFLEMKTPIRYSQNDPVEEWLNRILILDPTIEQVDKIFLPQNCTLFHVNKELLFSGNPQTEPILEELFSLFISSHYRNSPNDLQILSDSLNHEVFAFMSHGKRIICSVQIAFEGKCHKNAFNKKGDLIPWVLYDNFFNEELLGSYGIRIVRIAVHPSLVSMGYGSHCLNLLENAILSKSYQSDRIIFPKGTLFSNIDKIQFPQVGWIGVSFGLTENLLNFWKKLEFSPICLKQTPSKTTGEFSIVTIKNFKEFMNPEFIRMKQCFSSRFLSTISYSFFNLQPSLILSLIYSHDHLRSRKIVFELDEIERLKRFSDGILDIKNIIDILPDFAKISFLNKLLKNVSVLEQCVLIMISLQKKSVSFIADHFQIESFRIVNMVVKTVKRVLENGNFANFIIIDEI